MRTLRVLSVYLIIAVSVFCGGIASADGAKVVSLSGDVKVILLGEKEISLRSGVSLPDGARIKTGTDSYIGLAFGKDGGSTLNVSSESDVVLKLHEDKLELVDGEIFLLLKSLPQGGDFQIKTPAAVCGARGTGWVTRTRGEVTEILVFENQVYLKGLNKDGTLTAGDYWTERGYKRSVKRFHAPEEKKKLTDEELADMDEEATFAGNVVKFLARKDKFDAFDKKNAKRMDALDKRLEHADFGSRSGFDRIMDGGGATPIGGGRGDDDD